MFIYIHMYITCIYIHIYMYIYMYIYTYIESLNSKSQELKEAADLALAALHERQNKELDRMMDAEPLPTPQVLPTPCPVHPIF